MSTSDFHPSSRAPRTERHLCCFPAPTRTSTVSKINKLFNKLTPGTANEGKRSKKKKEREFPGMCEAGCKLHIVTKRLSVENSLLDHLDHLVVRSNTPNTKLPLRQKLCRAHQSKPLSLFQPSSAFLVNSLDLTHLCSLQPSTTCSSGPKG